MIECREIVDKVKEDHGCADCQSLAKEFEANPGGKPASSKGLVLAGITGGAAIVLSTICLPFVTPALRRVCLPFVPATDAQISNVIKALGKPGASKSVTRKLVDIGSGDGRIVLSAAREGFQAHGVELNWWLVLYSRMAAFRSGLRGSATFARQDLWNSDLRQYDNVVIFGVEEMMPQLEKKLDKELQAGSAIAACRFPFPTWVPAETIGDGIDSVWLYRITKPQSLTKETPVQHINQT